MEVWGSCGTYGGDCLWTQLLASRRMMLRSRFLTVAAAGCGRPAVIIGPHEGPPLILDATLTHKSIAPCVMGTTYVVAAFWKMPASSFHEAEPGLASLPLPVIWAGGIRGDGSYGVIAVRKMRHISDTPGSRDSCSGGGNNRPRRPHSPQARVASRCYAPDRIV